MNVAIKHTIKDVRRVANVQILKEQLPDAKVYVNENTNSFGVTLDILHDNIDNDLLIIEDDASLCGGFKQIAYPFIESNMDRVIQFMDLKKADFQTREMPASSFCMFVCNYIPAYMVGIMVATYNEYQTAKPEHKFSSDYFLRYCLQKEKQKYILHRPSLAQHLPFPSIMHKGASRGRQSLYFIDDMAAE